MSSGIKPIALTASATLTLAELNHGLIIAAPAAAMTLTLPAAIGGALNDTDRFVIKCLPSAFAVTINGNGKLIDGAATYVLPNSYDSIEIIYDGVQDAWYVLSSSAGASGKKTIIGPLADRDGAGVNTLAISETNNTLILINSAAAAQAANLPAVGQTENAYSCTIKREGAGFAVTVNPNGADTIDGAASFVLASDKDAIELVYVEASNDWKIV